MKVKKVLFRSLLVLLVLIVAVVVIGFFYMDSLAKAALERGGTYAMEVPMTATDVSVQPLRGRIVVDGLKIDNPEGFESPFFMNSGRLDMQVKVGSLLSDTVVLENFELDGLELNIEQTMAGANVSKIMDSLKRFESKEKPEEAEEGKKVQLDRVVIRNVVAHFRLLPGLASAPLTVKVPEIEIKDVTSDEAGGVMVSELIRRIVPIILASVLENAKGIVPGSFLKGLDSQVADVMKAVGGPLKDIVGKPLEQGAGALGGLLQGITSRPGGNE